MNKLLPRMLSGCKSLLTNSTSLLETNPKFHDVNLIQVRAVFFKRIRPLRARYPFWYLRKERATYYENISKKNREFIDEIVEDSFGPKAVIHGIETYDLKSPLQTTPFERGQWNIKSRRTGLIGKKIGVYPMWTNTGERVVTTLIQITDNHVIKYVPPEEFTPRKPRYRCIGLKRPNVGALYLGADSTDPQKFTKEYCGMFMKHGLMPKQMLRRFLITPEAAIQPGTPLYATHFKVGQFVDVRGTTIPRGFHGVMKRWGFHGMPATHGVTKTHRRPGCIGMGRNRRVQKGKKMPGHMGYKIGKCRGIEVLRINTKYNVLFLKGRSIPGETGSYVCVFDTNVTHKLWNHKNQPPYFPTFYPEDLKEPLPEDLYHPEIFDFAKPTIMYEIPKETKKRK